MPIPVSWTENCRNRGVFRGSCGEKHGQDDFTLFGKFNGIPQDVHEHLTKPGGISLYMLRDIGSDLAGKFKIPAVGVSRL